MRKIVSLLILVFLSVITFGQGIAFLDITPEEAIEKAKAENKYVFVDVYTDWCGPCKLMDAQIFPMKEIGDHFNPKYISIKLNAEKDEVGKAFREKYNIKAYPTFVILDGKGELLHIFAGGVLNLTFIDKTEEAFNPTKAFGILKKRYDNGERDPRFVATYIESLQNTYTADVNGMVEEFYSSTSDEDKICSECLFLFDNYARVWSEKDEFLSKHRERFREVAGREQVDAVFNRKYTAYYAQIIMGYDRSATEENIGKTNDRLATLGLSNTAIFPILQAAALARLRGEGADAVYEKMVQTAPAMSEDEKNTALYYVTIGLQEQLGPEQKKELIELITNEYTKGNVSRSVKL